MCVHACLESSLAVFFEGVGCHGYDRDAASRVVKCTDYFGCLVTIHVRHLNIHEDQVIVILRFRLQSFHAFNAICYVFCLKTAFSEKFHRDLCIQFIILCQQDTFAFEIPEYLTGLFFLPGLDLLFCRCRERQDDGCLGSLTDLTLDIDGAAHQINQCLDDRKSKSRTCHMALCTCSSLTPIPVSATTILNEVCPSLE